VLAVPSPDPDQPCLPLVGALSGLTLWSPSSPTGPVRVDALLGEQPALHREQTSS
jgi:hypothetical protein